ncbi:MAG: ribonuclease HII [Desulfurococcales archaeon]|nr:ribonuclease HII [Desulfurococcales archaeon]
MEGRPKVVVGVDEAGRGSLVGEMFVAGFAAPPEVAERLVEIGVKDSKLLSPDSRSRLYRRICRLGMISVVTVPPEAIDRENLTVLTERAILRIIRNLSERLGGIEWIAAIEIDRYGKPRILPSELERMGFRGLLVIEEKADRRYPHVAAASIVAKHLRDTRIRVLASLYGVSGSGYPSDPRTVEWVRKQLEAGSRPPIVRYSWSTLRRYGFGGKVTGEASNASRGVGLDKWMKRD